MTGERPLPSLGRDAPVIVVGAGPCGLSVAADLQTVGVPHLALDKSGVASAVANYPMHLTMFSTPEKLAIGGVPFMCAGLRPTRDETLSYYRSVVTVRGLNVRPGEYVPRVEHDGFGLLVHSARDGGVLVKRRAQAVVIATGYFDYPNMLGVPGEAMPHVSHRFIDGESAHAKDVLVVGGGNSAVEAAIDLARCGARVTLAHYEAGFVSHVIKPWILPEFEQRVAAGQVQLRWLARVRAIEPGRAHLTMAGAGSDANRSDASASGESAIVSADLVYLMTGYTPGPGLLGSLGVPFDAETGIPAHNPATMETSVRGVFVAGVLASGRKANGVFIENGRGHGVLIAAAIAAGSAR